MRLVKKQYHIILGFILYIIILYYTSSRLRIWSRLNEYFVKLIVVVTEKCCLNFDTNQGVLITI